MAGLHDDDDEDELLGGLDLEEELWLWLWPLDLPLLPTRRSTSTTMGSVAVRNASTASS